MRAQTSSNKDIFCLNVSDQKLTSQCVQLSEVYGMSIWITKFEFDTHVIEPGNKELNLDCLVYQGQKSPKM